ncbi:MAG: YceI family protein [Pseudomarimonas sp.]
MRTSPLKLSGWQIVLIALVFALASVSPVHAALATYRIDPVHTRVVFAVDHYAFSRALGTLSGASGTLRFDPDDWTTASVDVTIPLARLDLGDADWNTRMLKPDFFAEAEHPSARFVSTRIEPIDATHATIFGKLSLRGESREVSLLAKLNGRARHPLTLRRTVGFSATATVSRADFGMRGWKSAIGDSVSLIIEVEASRTRRAIPTEPAPPAASGVGDAVQ